MQVKNIVYISSYRLPTEKAEGLQGVRMCEAFAQHGLGVTLMHPKYGRAQIPILENQNVFKYYGVKRFIEVRALDCVRLDLLRFIPFMPRWLLSRIALAQSFLQNALIAFSARQERSDVYYTQDPLLAWWLTRLGLLTVYEAMGFPSRLVIPFVRMLGSSRYLLLLITITERLAKDLTRKLRISESQVKALHVGVDPEQFEANLSKSEARALLGYSEKEVLVVYTGGLRSDRGIDVLVDIAYLLNDVQFLLVGGRPQEVSQMEARVRKARNSNMKLLGHVPPARAALFQRAADVLVLPQAGTSAHLTYYTSPAKLFEYMLSGRPIVASDLPCIREVLEHGNNALLVKSDSPKAWADEINSLLSNADLGEKLARQAQKDAQQYTWKVRTDQILECVRNRSKF